MRGEETRINDGWSSVESEEKGNRKSEGVSREGAERERESMRRDQRN